MQIAGQDENGKPREVRTDDYGRVRTLGDPFAGGVAITPSADVITAEHRALWIGVGGTLAGTMLDEDGVTANSFATTVASGSVFPFKCLTVIVAGTTATGILAGW